jgi:hypothetical protein
MSEKIKTLQECKEIVAREDCWTSWLGALHEARKDFLDNIVDRAAELYAQQFKFSPNQLEKEIERLRQEVIDLEAWVTVVTNQRDRLLSVTQTQEQSNTELLEASRLGIRYTRELANVYGDSTEIDPKVLSEVTNAIHVINSAIQNHSGCES